MAVTWRLHGGYTVVTRRLHGGYTAATRRLHLRTRLRKPGRPPIDAPRRVAGFGAARRRIAVPGASRPDRRSTPATTCARAEPRGSIRAEAGAAPARAAGGRGGCGARAGRAKGARTLAKCRTRVTRRGIGGEAYRAGRRCRPQSRSPATRASCRAARGAPFAPGRLLWQKSQQRTAGALNFNTYLVLRIRAQPVGDHMAWRGMAWSGRVVLFGGGAAHLMRRWTGRMD